MVDVEDGDRDAPEHIVAPQVVHGDGPPQAQEATRERETTLTQPLKKRKLLCLLFSSSYSFCNFHSNLRIIRVSCFGTCDILTFS